LSPPDDECVIGIVEDHAGLLCAGRRMPLQTTNNENSTEIPMNKIAIAFLAAASLASFGCKKKGGGDMAAFEKHVDAVCACKDQACLDKENADFAKNNPPTTDPDAAKKMAEDPKAVELGKKMGDCMTKIMTAGAGAGMAGGAAGTPPAAPAPAADPAAAPPAAPAADPAAAPPAAPPADPAAGSGSAK
jgi:hypothetical protein